MVCVGEEFMENRLSIEIGNTKLEVIGSEALIRDIYADFKDQLSGGEQTATFDRPASQEPPLKTRKAKTSVKPTPKTAKKKPTGPKPTFDTSLNTNGLAEFYEAKSPMSHSEKILVFSAFLCEKLNVTTVSRDQIYTCYEVQKVKLPTAFNQAFTDAKNQKHFIEILEDGQLEITLHGKNHLNHELPASKS